ncbi:MAG: ATP12 family protein, partial [Pseudomonadota bacterium]
TNVPSSDRSFAVLLDGRAIKTPKRQPLHLPTTELAQAIAGEWTAQGEHVAPQSMPLTKLANTTIDGILQQPEAIRADILAFSHQDLICYRADNPAQLVDRQAKAWTGFVKWAEQNFKSTIVLATGVMPVQQSDAFDHGARTWIAKLDAWALGPVHVITTLLGSAIIALALEDGACTPDEAWHSAHVDEDWQISQWGEDAEAASRRAFRAEEMKAATHFLDLCRSSAVLEMKHTAE